MQHMLFVTRCLANPTKYKLSHCSDEAQLLCDLHWFISFSLGPFPLQLDVKYIFFIACDRSRADNCRWKGDQLIILPLHHQEPYNHCNDSRIQLFLNASQHSYMWSISAMSRVMWLALLLIIVSIWTLSMIAGLPEHCRSSGSEFPLLNLAYHFGPELSVMALTE